MSWWSACCECLSWGNRKKPWVSTCIPLPYLKAPFPFLVTNFKKFDCWWTTYPDLWPPEVSLAHLWYLSYKNDIFCLKEKRKNGYNESGQSVFFPIFYTQKMNESCSTDVNGAAEERSPFDGPPDDAEEVGGRLAEVVHLRHAARKVFKTLRCAAAWQSFITAIQPVTQTIRD